MICGVLKDKDTDKMTEILIDLGQKQKRYERDECTNSATGGNITVDFVSTEPDSERKLNKDQLKNLLENKGGHVIETADILEIVKSLDGKYAKYDKVMFVGSLYLIGEVRKKLTAQN